MRGSAGGPLGALLMIAPLAAIPIFAIVGVPQFAPVVASPSDDEDFADLGAPLISTTPEDIEPSPKSPAAEDVFAPASEPLPRPGSIAVPLPGGRQPAKLAAASGRARGTGRVLPRAEALDQWEVRPDAAGSLAGSAMPKPAVEPALRRQVAADSPDAPPVSADALEGDRVSVEGYSHDLFKPDSKSRGNSGPQVPGRPQREPAPKGRPAPSEVAQPAGTPDSPNIADLAAHYMAEQSGWQDAARRLKELGIRKYHLKSEIEEQTFTFVCTFASPENPRVVRRFEADADTPLEAVQKTLKQIDEWHSRDHQAGDAVTSASED